MTRRTFTILGVQIAALAAGGFAQLPASRVLTLEVAEVIAKEAMATCRARGYRATVLVVDSLNAPKVLIRDDGATASTTEVARMKATTAMLSEEESASVNLDRARAAAPPAAIPGTVNAGGGVPIKAAGITIGAVGISST